MTATVYYKWHPLAGQNLEVHKRKKDESGEYVFVRLPDETICGLPAWMFHPACAEFVVGPPLISIEALTELRGVLAELRTSPACDMASVKQLATEVPNEASTRFTSPTVQPAAGGSHASGAANGQRPGTRSRPRRTVDRRSKRKRPPKRGNRRSA